MLRGGAGYSPRRGTPQLTRGRPPVVVRAESRVWGDGSGDAGRALAHDPTAALQLCTRACCAAQLLPLIPVGCFHPPPEPCSPAVPHITDPHPSTTARLLGSACITAPRLAHSPEGFAAPPPQSPSVGSHWSSFTANCCKPVGVAVAWQQMASCGQGSNDLRRKAFWGL